MSWGSIAGAVIGGGLSYLGAKEQADAAEEASENSGAPWVGLQPYLTGSGPIPPWVTQSPWMGQDFQDWNQAAATGAEGSWLDPAPGMFQGGNPYDPVNYAQQQPTYAPQQQQMPQQAPRQLSPQYSLNGEFLGMGYSGSGGYGGDLQSGSWGDLSSAERAQAAEYMGMGLGIPGMSPDAFNGLTNFGANTLPGLMGFESDYAGVGEGNSPGGQGPAEGFGGGLGAGEGWI